MDREFEPVKTLCPLLEINTPAAREHVGEIERRICVVKERVRASSCEFPFRSIPKLVLIHTAYNSVLWLNAFPNRSKNRGFSPRELVTGISTNYWRDCKATIGDYVEASHDDEITNTNSERTHSCIYVGSAGNRQGSSKCFDLGTGKIVVRRTIKVLPWPDKLIRKAERWGERGKASILKGRIDFLNREN